MGFYAAFISISVTSRRQLTLFMFFPDFTSTRLGSEMSCQRALTRKTQWIQGGSNPGPLESESNTLPLKHAGPQTYYTTQTGPLHAEHCLTAKYLPRSADANGAG